MPGIRVNASFKSVSMILVLILTITLLISKNSQAVMRFMVGQEINLTTTAFYEIRTDHYNIKYTDIDVDWVPMVALAAEEAYGSVSQVFGEEPSKRTTIVIYPDSSSLARSFGWDRDEKAMGVYWAGSIRVLSPREWMTPQDSTDRFVQEGPMAHEFIHLMVDELTRGNYNRWWTEGVAQYVEKRTTGFEFASPFTGGEETSYYHLASLDRNFDKLDQSIAYWESLQVIEYIAQTSGEESLFQIMAQLGDGKSLSTAIEKTQGVSYRTWEQEFYRYLENNY
ncbi:MAG: hypothetical protein GXY34_07350 [Syntrophomonadaceae bacterium]|nr:hypothetical protein [Syntrophomonadaceae bacterium]